MLDDVTDFCRLILLRYPELEAEHRDVAIGAGSAPLSRRGVASVAHWLQDLAPVAIDKVFVAPQEQCTEPGRALANGKGVECVEEPRIADQNMGRWQGRNWQEVLGEEPALLRDFFENLGEVQPPEGESLGAAVERMLSWWTETSAEGLSKTFVVVTAGSMVTGFAAAMLGLRLSRCMSLALPHGGMGILDCFANGARIASWRPDALIPDR